jgi:hypothetical protein
LESKDGQAFRVVHFLRREGTPTFARRSENPHPAAMTQEPPLFNCPICPRRMTHVMTIPSDPHWDLEALIYRCPVHGLWRLEPDGRFVLHRPTVN